MTAYEFAKKYYPDLWPLERLDAMLAAGKISKEQYNEIVKEEVCV